MGTDKDEREGMIDAVVNGDDSDFWAEQVQIDRWMDAGCPPVDEWLGKSPKPKTPKLQPGERLAVSKREAGELLGGKSEDWIEKHVLPHVATVKSSRSVLIPNAELQRWVHENSGRAT